MAAQTASKVDFNGFDEFLRSRAQALVSELEAGNMAEAMGLINELQFARHQVFYNEVGHLTRGLHEAIKSFSSDVGEKMPSDAESTVSAIGDASDRLNYVIELTEKMPMKPWIVWIDHSAWLISWISRVNVSRICCCW